MMNVAFRYFLPFLAAIPCANGNLQQSRRMCTAVDDVVVIDLPFNAAFTEIDGSDLFVTSFFNVEVNTGPGPPFNVLERDLVAKIDISGIESGTFVGPEELTDLGQLFGPPKTVWPNEAIPVPSGIFPFNALLIPQGFHPAPFPGRLSVINLDDPSRQEYIIDQSTQTGGFTGPFNPANSPEYYHNAVFYDMDNDGLTDIVTVRSGFRVGQAFHPPSGDLVWFKNPGPSLDPNVEWQEIILFGGPFNFNGPDIFVQMYDFEDDGIPEFVATHFFTGGNATDPDNGKFTIYGAPEGQDWSAVNALDVSAPVARVKDITVDQGKPFGIKLVDINGDGRIDILATNHQPDGSERYPSNVPGRVLAFEQPSSGDVFVDDWIVHILLDGIRPQPSLEDARSSRLAPGDATVFYADSPNPNKSGKPWIVVGGDEAGKVWLLRPKPKSFQYKEEVIFDINEVYGPGTTQTKLESPNGITISTIGKVTVAPSSLDDDAVLVFVPVFEGRAIHVLRVNVKCS